MRNPSAYVSNYLNAQICCILIMIFILYASLVLGLGLARTMLIFEKIKRIIFAKIFDFKFSHRRESTRRGGVANFTGVAASGGGVHPWDKHGHFFLYHIFCSFYNIFITTLRVAAELYIQILIN